ncbi:hypothetical protein E4U53_002966, partial [Claviceps sorghi]
MSEVGPALQESSAQMDRGCPWPCILHPASCICILLHLYPASVSCICILHPGPWKVDGKRHIAFECPGRFSSTRSNNDDKRSHTAVKFFKHAVPGDNS